MPLREIPYIQDLHFGALIALHRSGERGNRLRHAHTGIQPGIDGARGGGSVFRRYQTEWFAVGVTVSKNACSSDWRGVAEIAGRCTEIIEKPGSSPGFRVR
jgi:hypothetical protein